MSDRATPAEFVSSRRQSHGPAVADSCGRVLVVDDHAAARRSMADVLGHFGHDVTCCSSAAEALRTLEDDDFDCVVTDLMMPGMTGVELIGELGRRGVAARAVMVTAHASVETAVEAMRLGAFDYIEKPFDSERLERLVGQAVRHRRLVDHDDSVPAETNADSLTALIGESAAMRTLRDRIQRVAATSETVLIAGENGTGKELVARAVHAGSARSGRPLVSLNCPVLSEHLLESELFGHEKGAFTGAERQRIGRFEQADGGTILLDEVTEIELPLQAKLLRVLQEQAFERVGSGQTIKVDVRVIATTNRDLREAVDGGQFREDLYFRLNVLPLHVPPLRERTDDIPRLVDHFLHRAAARLGRAPARLDDGALEVLTNYRWPGNVRELENLITRASVLEDGETIAAASLRRWLGGAAAPEPPSRPADEVGTTRPAVVLHQPDTPRETDDDAPRSEPSEMVGMSIDEMERALIEATLQHYAGHRAKTAKALGIGVRTLSGKLRRYGYPPGESQVRRSA